jgi:hypothetical protein
VTVDGLDAGYRLHPILFNTEDNPG